MNEGHYLYKENSDISNKSVIFLRIYGFIISLIVLISGLFLSREIVRPINDTKEQLRIMASNDADLNTQLHVKLDNEIRDMAKWYNVFTKKFNSVFISISELVNKNNRLSTHLNNSSKDSTYTITEINDEAEILKSNSEKLVTYVESANSSIDEILSSVFKLTEVVNTQFSVIDQSSSSTEEIMGSVANVANISSSRLSSIEDLVTLIDNGGKRF